MSIRDTIVQGVREWMKTVLSLTDEDVIVAEDPGKGPKPALPFATVRVSALGLPVSGDEIVDSFDGGGVAQTQAKGNRQATVAVDCYGTGADDWPECLRLALMRDVSDLTAAGISVYSVTSPLNVNALIDTGYERRTQTEFAVYYRAIETPSTILEAETLTVDTTLTDSAPSDFSTSLTVDLT